MPVVTVSVCILLTLFSFAHAQALEPQKGGTLTVGMEMEPRGFDPIAAGYLSARARSQIVAIEERLFDADEEGKILPELALSATPSDDQKSWTIKLRQGVKFHDGVEMTSDDVVFTFDRVIQENAIEFGSEVVVERIQECRNALQRGELHDRG